MSKTNNNKGYLTHFYMPKRNEVTASALFHLKEFIRVSGDFTKLEDWILTKRENQVIALMAEGLNNDEIAERLELSPPTISSNITDIYRRYGVEGKIARTKAVLIYLNRAGRLNGV